jgi:hypothetical protein
MSDDQLWDTMLYEVGQIGLPAALDVLEEMFVLRNRVGQLLLCRK